VVTRQAVRCTARAPPYFSIEGGKLDICLCGPLDVLSGALDRVPGATDSQWLVQICLWNSTVGVTG
jgi:hypothetical protein